MKFPLRTTGDGPLCNVKCNIAILCAPTTRPPDGAPPLVSPPLRFMSDAAAVGSGSAANVPPQTANKITEKVFSLKTRKVIDEDALLTDEDRQAKVPRTSGAADCTTRRRACKNCSCGRAELEAKLVAQGKLSANDDVANAEEAAMLAGPPAGGCGNCSRGDAFRCAGCPFLGKAAWNTSATGAVKIDLTDDK